jgi:hypothetical protein
LKKSEDNPSVSIKGDDYKKYLSGIPIGYKDLLTGNFYVFNHHELTIKIHAPYKD